MLNLLLFVLFFFVLIIAIPIISIIRVLASARRGNAHYKNRQTEYKQPEKQSPVNKRFDKSKAEDVEFEEV